MSRPGRLLDDLVTRIGEGRLSAGARLPTQRAFAKAHGVAVSTANRIYGELARRGLVVGEVGRGTFVRTAESPPMPALVEPAAGAVDLALNAPLLPEQAHTMARSLDGLLRRTTLFEESLRPVAPRGTAQARAAAARFLARGGWRPTADDVLFTGNGKQALAAAVAGLVERGGRLGADTLSYPVLRGIAARLGVELVAIAGDAGGMSPDALEAAHARSPLRAVYCQPLLHNPLGTTMSAARRAALVRVLRRLGLVAIEDAVYAFLAGGLPPLAALAPERVIVVDSLSKRLAPGLTLGFVLAPREMVAGLASAIRAGALGPPGFALAACGRWMEDGTAEAVCAAKRRDAAKRQRLAATAFAGLSLAADPRSYHGWLTLPAGWRAEDFVVAAAREGIAITPAAAFALGAGHAPNAVRLAFATPALDTLAAALRTLAALARGGPSAVREE